MNIPGPPRRRAPESVVPMINVVFLLLIFFLMTAEIVPPDPLEVTPPLSEVEDVTAGDLTLYIGADGTLAYGDARGDAEMQALLAAATPGSALLIRADARLPATTLAALLPRLSVGGFAGITLVTGRS